MPRFARIDIPGLLQHVIVRGIERRPIFVDDHDKTSFLSRFSHLLLETQTDCFAWALLDNHFHLLLYPQTTKLGLFMRRLLTGYAVEFNIRHKRAGHLFQNRYKSIVCDKDVYFQQLIRYIHLNPLKAHMVQDLDALDHYPWTGHAVLMGHRTFDGQKKDEVLALFGDTAKTACKGYRQFMLDGLKDTTPINLSGGGKRRSLALDPSLDDKGMFDDRILGGGAFVQNMLETTGLYDADIKPIDLDGLIKNTAAYFEIDPAELHILNKSRPFSLARAVVCHLGTKHLSIKGTKLAAKLSISSTGVTVAARRGALLVQESPKLLELVRNKESKKIKNVP